MKSPTDIAASPRDNAEREENDVDDEPKKIMARIFAGESLRMFCEKTALKILQTKGEITLKELRRRTNEISVAFQQAYSRGLEEVRKELKETGGYSKCEAKYSASIPTIDGKQDTLDSLNLHEQKLLSARRRNRYCISGVRIRILIFIR
ncbi:hypothetical protein AAMO2058_001065900 [Amorphochlora amoebiformis]